MTSRIYCAPLKWRPFFEYPGQQRNPLSVVTHERPSGTFGYETLRGVFSGHFGCELRRSEAVLLRIFVEETLRCRAILRRDFKVGE